METLYFDMYFLQVQQPPASMGKLTKIAVNSESDIWGLVTTTKDSEKINTPVRLVSGNEGGSDTTTWATVPLPDGVSAGEIQCTQDGMVIVSTEDKDQNECHIWMEDTGFWSPIYFYPGMENFAAGATNKIFYTYEDKVYQYLGFNAHRQVSTGVSQFDKVAAAADGTLIASYKQLSQLYKLIEGEVVTINPTLPSKNFYKYLTVASASHLYLVSEHYILRYIGEKQYQYNNPVFYTWKDPNSKKKGQSGKKGTNTDKGHYKFVVDSSIKASSIVDISSGADIPLALLAENSKGDNILFIQSPFPPKYHGNKGKQSKK